MSAAPTLAEKIAAARIVSAVQKTFRELGYRSENPKTAVLLEEAFAQMIAQETGGVESLNALKACIHEFEGDSGTGASYWSDRPVYINARKAVARHESRA